MKIRVFILFLFFSIWSYAQSVSIELKDEPLSSAFKKIEQKAGYRILFTYDDIQEYKVTTSIQSTSALQAVQTLIDGKPLFSTLKGNNYIVVTSLSDKMVFSLKGVVNDSIGNPIENATLMLYREGKIKTGAISDREGKYFIPYLKCGKYQLSTSYLGYETAIQTISVSSDLSLPPILLKERNIKMNEVIIKGETSPFKMKNGSIIADIAHSTLSKETDITEMLRKLPGMALDYGKLVTFTGQQPQIYINGKKSSGIDEVKQLEIRNIKNVELITHPGAEYDSSVTAVMLITTFHRQEGWAIQLDGNWQVNHRFSNKESIKANYHHKNFTLSGTFTYEDYRRQSHQIMRTEITTPDTLWQHITNMRTEAKESIYYYSAGVDYNLDKKHSLGMQYSGSHFTENYTSPMPTQSYANGKNYDELLSHSHNHMPEYRHYLNAYYTGDWSSKLSFKIYADYALIHSSGKQIINETSQREINKEIHISTYDRYRLYAVSPTFIYQPSPEQTLTWGNEWSRIDRKNSLTYNANGENSNTQNKEEKHAVYFSYTYQKKRFSVTTGLRYEHVLSDYRDLWNTEQNECKKYNYLFPSIGISYNQHPWSHSLNYRAGTHRPRFALLNKNIYYMNRFLYQEGNPKLKSQFYHHFQYSLTWKDYLFASLSYTYNKDYINSYSYTPSSNSPVHYYTWHNYDKQQQIAASVSLHKRFGAYEPSLTFIYNQNIQTVNTINGICTPNKPYRAVRLENNLHLSHHWLATIEYQYGSVYSSNFFTFREKHTLHIGLTKSFLHENLLFKIKGYNLLRKRMNLYDGYINNIYFWQDERQDERNVSLNIMYRFNNYSKKYKGKNADKEMMNRL